MFSKKSDEGDSKMEHGHDYVDYDSTPIFCSKFLVCLHIAYVLLIYYYLYYLIILNFGSSL